MRQPPKTGNIYGLGAHQIKECPGCHRRFFNRLGIHPNIITISSLAGNITGAVFVGFGHLTIGGLIVLVTAPLDAIDGAMARSEAR